MNMAFSIYRFTRVSLADNTGALTGVLNPSSTSVVFNGPAFFTYASADDAIATVAGANYFSSQAFNLKVGDVIMCVASDASEFLEVATVDTSVSPATITTTPFTASASVDTANIVDGAITNAKVNAAAAIDFSKLATLASGNILVGSAGGVATSVASSGDVTVVASGAFTIGANKVVSSMLADTLLHYVAVPITAAAFNGAYAAPVVLVAAPGANKLLVLDKVQLLMTYGTAAYAAGGVAAIQYDVTANGAGVIASTTLSAATFQATASTGWNFNAGVVAETFTTCVNKSLALSNITGAFTTGNSPMVAHVWYKIIPTV
jgi:hypothetical protein